MPASALPLHVWLSPAFPVGSFAYSHGLEWAVEAGIVSDAASLASWLEDLTAHGAVRSDTILVSMAWHAAKNGDLHGLGEINALALALAGGRERALETSAQGTAFLSAACAAWPCAILLAFRGEFTGPMAYPVALGMAAGGHNIALPATLEAFALAFVAMLVSAAVRLGPIGQSQAQLVTAGMLPSIRALALEAAGATMDDLGSCAFRSDICALQHETQYSRLFRS